MKINDTITLKEGKWEAGICPRLGANIVYLKFDGKNILRPLKDEKDLEANPYIQGAPILLPANRTYLGKFTFEGIEYTLPINEERTNSHLHGIVHTKSFDLVEANDEYVIAKYSNHGECYPFNFDLTVKYAIDAAGLTAEYTITNTDKKNMPYTFCLHSTFMQPESFTMPVGYKQETVNDIPTGEYLPLTEQETKYISGSPSKDLNVCGYYISRANIATIDNIMFAVSDNFDHWITYNAQGKRNFICIEPQAGDVNGLNTPDGYKVLTPGESTTYMTRYFN